MNKTFGKVDNKKIDDTKMSNIEKLNVDTKYKNKKDVKNETMSDFIVRFLKLSPKQARPLKKILRTDTSFTFTKDKRNRYTGFYINGVLTQRSVFMVKLKKYFSELKKRWQTKSIRKQRVNENYERVQEIEDPKFEISTQYSNKYDDRIRLINDIIVTKEEYKRRWKEYLKELQERFEKLPKHDDSDDDFIRFRKIFEELERYGKEYITVNKNYVGIEARVYTHRNLLVDKEMLESVKDIISQLEIMSVQVVIENLENGKVMTLNPKKYDFYMDTIGFDIDSVDKREQYYIAGSDVFGFFSEIFLEKSDYVFSLIPIAPEKVNPIAPESVDGLSQEKRSIFSGIAENIKKARQGNLSPFVFNTKLLSRRVDGVEFSEFILGLNKEKIKITKEMKSELNLERNDEEVTPQLYDQICDLFDDVQVYTEEMINDFKFKKLYVTPCLDYSIKRCIEKQIINLEGELMSYAQLKNYSLKWDDDNNEMMFEKNDEYEEEYLTNIHEIENLKSLLASFYVPQTCRSRYGYVPLVQLQKISDANNVIIKVCKIEKHGNNSHITSTIKPECINNLTVFVTINFCVETEHYYAQLDYAQEKIKWSILIPGKKGHILSSRCFYNSLKEIKYVRMMCKAEKLSTMGYRTFDKTKFEFTPHTITTSSYDDKLDRCLNPEKYATKDQQYIIEKTKHIETINLKNIKKKDNGLYDVCDLISKTDKLEKLKNTIERGFKNKREKAIFRAPLIKECQTQEEFDVAFENLKKDKKPLNVWNKALLVTFDFETFKTEEGILKTTKGKLNLPMSCSVHYTMLSKDKQDMHYCCEGNISCYSPDIMGYIKTLLNDLYTYYKLVLREIMRVEKIKYKQAASKYHPQIAAHNLSYDLAFFIPYLKNVELFGSTSHTKIATATYMDMKLTFLNTTNFFPMALAKIAKSFKIDNLKEVFPYDYYNSTNFNKEWEDLNVYCECLISDDDKLHVGKVCVEKGWYNSEENKINIKEYRKYYNNLDVSILSKVVITFWELIHNETGIDVSHLKTSGSVVKFLYEKLGCFIGTHELTGDLSEYIRQSLQGGRVATAYNKGKIIEEKIKIGPETDKYNEEEGKYCLADLDVNSEYPAAMYQMKGFLKGKPHYFPGVNKQTMFNDTKISDLKLYTSKGEEVTDYFAKIKILNVNKCLDIPFISEMVGGVRNYTNEPNNEILVNKTMLEVYGRYHGLTQKDFTITSGMQYVDGYNQNVSFFTKRLYEIRKSPENAGTAVDECLKLLLNSGYGKLGEREYDLKIVYTDSHTDAEKIYYKNPTGFVSSEVNFFSTLIKGDKIDKLISGGTTECERLKITYISEKVKEYSSYAHESYRCLAKSKMIIGEYQYALRKAGFKLRYTDTDSLHVTGFTKEKYEKFKKIYTEHTGKEFSETDLGGISSDFKKPLVGKDEKLIEDSLICRRAVYIRAKQYYMEIYYTVELPTLDENGKNIREVRRYPVVKCKGIKTNSIINHALLVEKDHSDKCDALFNFYKVRCHLQENEPELMEELKNNKNKVLEFRNKYIVDSAENGTQFSVQYVYGAPIARTNFKRMF